MIEIELKSIPPLAALEKIRNNPGTFALEATETQLNHYFLGALKLRESVEDVNDIADALLPSIGWDKFSQLVTFLDRYKDAKQSVRTRASSTLAASHSLLIIKISMNDTSSENGTIRREFELQVPLPIDKLDRTLHEQGLSFQSKWRRHRDTYKYLDTTVCVDFNVGYGSVLEIEKIVKDDSEAEATRKYLHEILESLGCKELDQTHLEKMFAVYNENWQKFYDSGKTFADFPEYAKLLEV